jgi:hypothetical protein
MSSLDRDALRALVRETLRDALPDLAADLAVDGADTRWVELRDDGDLARFVAEIVRVADDPGDGPRLRDGRLRFRLRSAPTSAGPPAAPSAAPAPADERFERGPVTERHVRAAEASGARLVLGPAAVLTPMARDRARSAGVEIVRERKGQA